MATAGNCVGIIPLGNRGVGKSYLMNMLIGKEIFKSKNQASSVTAQSIYHEVSVNTSTLLRIYDVPGLVELDQEKMDHNIKEIKKAFKETRKSLVIFVWTAAVGGRVQKDDVIAFQSLYESYMFPDSSIIHVITGLSEDDETANYLEKFLEEVTRGVEILVKGRKDVNIRLLPQDFIIINKIEKDDEVKKAKMREKLQNFIDKHSMMDQEEKKPLKLSVSDVASRSMAIGRVPGSGGGGGGDFLKGLWKDFTQAIDAVIDGAVSIFQGVASLIGCAVVITGAGIRLVTVGTVSPALMVGNIIAGGISSLFSSK